MYYVSEKQKRIWKAADLAAHLWKVRFYPNMAICIAKAADEVGVDRSLVAKELNQRYQMVKRSRQGQLKLALG